MTRRKAIDPPCARIKLSPFNGQRLSKNACWAIPLVGTSLAGDNRPRRRGRLIDGQPSYPTLIRISLATLPTGFLEANIRNTRANYARPRSLHAVQ